MNPKASFGEIKVWIIITSISPSSTIAEEIHAQPSFKDEDTSTPTSEGKSTAHDTKVKKGLPEIKQKGSELVLDPHKFPKAHKADEGRSSKSTAGDPAALPASQVNVSAVDNTPHTKKDAEPKPRRSTGDIGVDTRRRYEVSFGKKDSSKSHYLGTADHKHWKTCDDLHRSALKPTESQWAFKPNDAHQPQE